MRIQLLIICYFVSFVQLRAQDATIYGDKQEEIFRTYKVKTMTERRVDDLDEITVYQIDENGRIQHRLHGYQFVQEYTDEAFTEGDTVTDLYEETAYTYADDRLIYTSTYERGAPQLGDTTFYRYRNNQLVETSAPGLRQVMHYNKEGQLAQLRLYFEPSDTTDVYTEDYLYNNQGQLIIAKTRAGNFHFDINYGYDDEGRILEEYHLVDGRRVPGSVDYTYKNGLIQSRIASNPDIPEALLSTFFTYAFYP